MAVWGIRPDSTRSACLTMNDESYGSLSSFICIDTARLTGIKFAPPADLPDAHRTARTARGPQQIPPEHEAGAEQKMYDQLHPFK